MHQMSNATGSSIRNRSAFLDLCTIAPLEAPFGCTILRQIGIEDAEPSSSACGAGAPGSIADAYLAIRALRRGGYARNKGHNFGLFRAGWGTGRSPVPRSIRLWPPKDF
jgi:hypothetical protein